MKRFLFTVVVVTAVGFGLAMLLNDESAEQTWNRIVTSAKKLTSPGETPATVATTPAATPDAPAATATPVPETAAATPPPAPVATAAPVASTNPSPGVSIYVSPTGSDTASGDAEHPFQSLTKGQEAARAIRQQQPAQPVTVWLGGGDYFLPKTFALEGADSGTAQAPVTYRAIAGQRPRLIGGLKVTPEGGFHPIKDPAVLSRLDPAARGKVWEADLDSLGIQTITKFPDLFVGNAGLFQLFYNGQRMPIARWPNDGYTTIKEVTDSGMTPKPHGGTFLYRDDRATRWQKAAQAQELYVACFWRVPWVIQAVRVEKLDPAKKSITLGAAVGGGIGSKYTPLIDGTRKGNGKENYYVFNLLEELDQPGEWCYRFSTKKLYFWPPPSATPPEVILADRPEPVISLDDASHVTLRGLRIEGSLTSAIQIRGGDGNLIAGCTIRNTGGTGITIDGGTGHGVQSCDLSNLGAGGIKVSGGDRKTLTPSGHFVDNTRIHHIGAVEKVVSGIDVNGVGTRLTHNLIHDVPNSGVTYSGNEHHFEFNEMHNLGLDSGDLGGFYTNGDWASRGNLIRANFIHHSPAANSVYLDDGDGGDEVTGNIFYQNECGIFVSGGPDNLVKNNLVIECAKGLHLDDRGISRHYNTDNPKYMKPLLDYDYKNPPWSVKYPALVKVLDKNPELPNGTAFIGNVLVNCVTPINIKVSPASEGSFIERDNLVLDTAPAFTNPAELDFTLPKESEIFSKVPGFQPIPIAQIGLYADANRSHVPTRAETGGNEVHQRGPVFNSEVDMKRSNELEGTKKKP